MRGRLLITFTTAVLCTAVVVVAAGAQGARDVALLLPDLVQGRPSGLSIRPDDGRVLLGFNSAVTNVGAGPLTIEGARRSRSTPLMTATQVVRRGRGRALRRAAAGALRYTREVTHEHWHLLSFDRYTLRRAGTTQTIVADRKTGFCLGDRYDVALGRVLPGEPAAPPYGRNCGLRRPDLLRVTSGISVGYGDNYDAYREGQHLDITDVPAGAYELVHRVNGDGRLLEQRYSNNASCLGLELTRPAGAPLPTLRVTGPC